MSESTSSESLSDLKIGDVFTPPEWGAFAVEKFGVFEQWVKGASVFDPTMGTGNLLEALIDTGLKKGYTLDQLPTDRLFGNELNQTYHRQALTNFLEKYGWDMSDQFSNEDILDFSNSRKFDVVLGNPPWINFVDLPDHYKTIVKSAFFEYDLVRDSRNLLLGGSRIDFAALVIQKSMLDFLTKEGNAYFFLPLSLLLNDGANQEFRTYCIGETHFAPKAVYDFNQYPAFKDISTRYGLVHFKRDAKANFPIPYFHMESNQWNETTARPIFHPHDPLSIQDPKQPDPLATFTPVQISKNSIPRQGINTCGANAVFFFDEYQQTNDSMCVVNGSIQLPAEFVYPLLTSANFSSREIVAKKWVLLPYQQNGKPLTLKQLKAHSALYAYLLKHRQTLESRKGSLIGNWIQKERWWALLGVGPYNFSRHKVVWQAYGKKTFNPILVPERFQANQSLQAYMPFNSKKEANRVFRELRQPAVEAYLRSLRMEGTMNWAQPGKVKKLIRYTDSD